MLDHLTALLDRLCMPLLAGSAMLGGTVLATGSPVDGWATLWEKGGIALVMAVCAYLLGKAAVPPTIKFITDYLNTLELRNAENAKRWEARMDAKDAQFLEALREERESRAATEKAFTTALDVHRNETVGAIQDQTQIFENLVEQLSDRPCQAKTFKFNEPSGPAGK
jgi:hypothetical protein